MSNAGKKQVNKSGDERGVNDAAVSTQFKAGKSGNPAGKKKGQRNYATIYREALKYVAEKKDMADDDVELALVIKGLERALKGDFKYYQDIQDRIHGKPVQTNLNKDLNDAELDEAEINTMDAMLAKFIKPAAKPETKKKPAKKAAKKKTAKKPVVIKSKKK